MPARQRLGQYGYDANLLGSQQYGFVSKRWQTGRDARHKDLVSSLEVLQHGATGARQIAKIGVIEDRGSARAVPLPDLSVNSSWPTCKVMPSDCNAAF